jgi:hypothetical protein
MSKKQTFVTFDSHAPLQLGRPEQLVVRPQVPRIKPYRLRIDPTIAPFFIINDIRIVNRSMFPIAQDVPASQFMHGNGEPFDCEEVLLATDFTMVVTNVSHRVPGAPCACGRIDGTHARLCTGAVGVPLPFVATWACLLLPPKYPERHSYSTGADYGIDASGDEDVGSRIARVPEVVGRPAVVRREHPGFGWDPHGD